MSGLVLKLGPKERVLINGAVIENGDRRSRLAVMTPDAHILRLRDAIHPEDAATPARRLCYTLQLILTGDNDPQRTRHALLSQFEELSQIFTDPDSRQIIAEASNAFVGQHYYRAMKTLKSLFPREDRLLALRRG